ncbi:hypothetical protein I79_004398 [Cricetulus griseus]|uniref:Uncharacterized protein n=1 Tax=Cricetulus griseus TaxID=10029 RepID=G3H2I5_CRIGR|nr:hypothetical protein I79_004398 [Cricetulus griseus]
MGGSCPSLIVHSSRSLTSPSWWKTNPGATPPEPRIPTARLRGRQSSAPHHRSIPVPYPCPTSAGTQVGRACAAATEREAAVPEGTGLAGQQGR